MGKAKSLASNVFDILVGYYPINKTFTAVELKLACELQGLKVSDGVIAGFLFRATTKGLLQVDDSFKTPSGKTAYIYRVKNHNPWKFQAPSIGSESGRTIKHGQPQYNGEPITVITSKAVTPIGKILSEEPIGSGQATARHLAKKEKSEALTKWAESCVVEGTAMAELELRLIESRYLQRALAGTMPKALQDIEDDDLLSELHRRISGK